MKNFLTSPLFLSLFLSVMLLSALTGCTKTDKQTSSAPGGAQNTQPGNLSAVVTPPGSNFDLKIEDPIVGTGAEAKAGKKVTVHYTGWLVDGKEFDSSKKANKPFEFQLGAGQVIKGWDQGVVGMKVGGKRKLLIPSSLAYGERGAGGVIPPNAALVFEIDLLKVE